MRVDARTAHDLFAYGVTATLDGIDITNDCLEADDVEGWAVVLLRNGDGQHYVDPWTDRMATAKRYGVVVITALAPIGESDG